MKGFGHDKGDQDAFEELENLPPLPGLMPCEEDTPRLDVRDEWDEIEGFVVTTARCESNNAAVSAEADRVDPGVDTRFAHSEWEQLLQKRRPILDSRAFATNVLRSDCWSGLRPDIVSRVRFGPTAPAFADTETEINLHSRDNHLCH